MKKILIADDEREPLAVLEKKLTEHNYSVKAVTSGQAVLRHARINPPDLLLLDIGMPDMDGYAVAAALREDPALKNLPIVFITGQELLPEGIEKRGAEVGAYDFIMKPCTFEQVLAKVKEIIG